MHKSTSPSFPLGATHRQPPNHSGATSGGLIIRILAKTNTENKFSLGEKPQYPNVCLPKEDKRKSTSRPQSQVILQHVPPSMLLVKVSAWLTKRLSTPAGD